MYAIVENNQPRAASPAAVTAHVEARLGGQHSAAVIRQWTEDYRNELGVYTIFETKAPLLDYQEQREQSLVFSDGKVTRTFAAVDVALDRAKNQAKEKLAAKRYDVETGGISVGDVTVDTTRESQMMIMAARTLAKEDANYTVNWKTADDTFATLDATTIIAVADAVRVHVQACFDNEKTLLEAINASTSVDALRAVDVESGW